MKKVIIVDLDGTLSDGRHRLHLLPTKEDRHLDTAWAKFNLASSDDTPFTDTIETTNALKKVGYKIIILTGRGALAKEVTVKWLAGNKVEYDELIMRDIGDQRQDTVFKTEVVTAIGLDNILCCFDDLPHIVQCFRDLGLTCYQVSEPDEQYVESNRKKEND